MKDKTLEFAEKVIEIFKKSDFSPEESIFCTSSLLGCLISCLEDQFKNEALYTSISLVKKTARLDSEDVVKRSGIEK